MIYSIAVALPFYCFGWWWRGRWENRDAPAAGATAGKQGSAAALIGIALIAFGIWIIL